MLIPSYKIFVIFVLHLITSVISYAKTIEQQKHEFPIKSQELFKGEIHFYFEILSPSNLTNAQSVFLKLDSLGITKDPESRIEVAKAVYVVNLPVGFFDDKELTGLRFLSHMMKPDKIRNKKEGLYEVFHEGSENYSYEMRSYFDADDISTLPNSKISRSILAAKELDVISKSASTIMVTEKSKFSNLWPGSVIISSFIPIKENKTLVVSYHLTGRKKISRSDDKLKENFKNEIERTRNLQNSFIVNQDEILIKD
jgi:hypothetical protein